MIDPGRVARLVAEAAAEEILPRFGRLDPGEVREKGPNDLVTVADLAMEARLTRDLVALLPGSVVVGEEAVANDQSVHDGVSADAPVWIVDPVDGTANFAQGRPFVAVIVALAVGGVTVAGWIHDPLAGRMVIAERGAGAWLDGRRARVRAAPASIADATGALSARYFAKPMRQSIEARRNRVGPSRPLFCAGHEYLRLIDGSHDFSLYNRIMPWDHAAGCLIHAEAGGWAAKLDASPYGPRDRDGGLLLANDADTWAAIHRALIADL
jgi:fructose-1,6-bisphosphatase/inositol monophosphatase family enzyme